ncbi:TonB-dependent siderophore receptor [Aureimonas pseudogalii]|uniref:Iron complex outermembrane receptor protein n=1 Tax=Aureimonas pseudogalii TaxID=1744844 RepID=A0A7W6H7Y5_9HYPH|nr:TonB-dependent siderophore receptor [Aureimonas pseudogalii]MBB4000295.1 iron complex outermembrane receptor protein [Aureimonas pseudogalii]
MIEGSADGVTADGRSGRILAKRSVSTTRTDTPVIETPQSVSTVTRKQLDDQNPQTVGNALRYTAGVLSDPDATTRYDAVFLRGFGGFGTSTSYVNFLDGLRLPRGQGFGQFQVDPFLLDRVDVLKGPAALLYGQVSPGGLVNQVSRMPSGTPYNEVRLEGGTHRRVQSGYTTQGAFDEAAVWQYSLSAIGRRADTRYDGVEEERLAIAPAIAWEPDADTRLTVLGSYQKDPEGGYFNSLYPGFLAPQAYRPYLNRDLNVGDAGFEGFEREQGMIGYRFEHRFNETVEVRSKLRYADVSTDVNAIQFVAPLGADGILPRAAFRSDEHTDGLATNNEALLRFDTGLLRHELLAGIDTQAFDSDWRYGFAAVPGLDVVNPRYGVDPGPFLGIIDTRQKIDQTGTYLQDQIALGNWRGLLGIRHDWTGQDTINRLTNVEADQSSQATTYRAGLLYLFDTGIAPYASYATSFEPVVGVNATGTAFDPTEAEQFEIGIKYEPTFLDALFTVSAFDIRQENVLTPGSAPGFNIQTGEIRSRGLEFEARGNATDNLEIIAALTLLDTEVTQTSVTDARGKRPQAVPNHFGSLWANYTFDRTALEGLQFGAGLRFVGSSFADDANRVKADGYTLVDLSMRYDLGSADPKLAGTIATLDVKNLFDEDYYSSCSFNMYCQFGSERQILGGLRKIW